MEKINFSYFLNWNLINSRFSIKSSSTYNLIWETGISSSLSQPLAVETPRCLWGLLLLFALAWHKHPHKFDHLCSDLVRFSDIPGEYLTSMTKSITKRGDSLSSGNVHAIWGGVSRKEFAYLPNKAHLAVFVEFWLGVLRGSLFT